VATTEGHAAPGSDGGASMAPAMLGDGIVHSPTGAAALAHGAVEPGSDADALPAATASDSDGAVGPAVGPPLAIIIRMPPSAAVVSPACIASQRHQRGLVSDSSLHADGSGALSSFGWRCMRCSDRCRRLPPRHCPRVSRVPGSRLCSDDYHPHGVAIRCPAPAPRPAARREGRRRARRRRRSRPLRRRCRLG